MSLITLTQPADGETIDAADVNNPLNTIVNDYNGNINSDNLANNAVTNAKMADNAVDTAEIVDGAVTTDKLEDGSVTAGKIGASAVTTSKVNDSAITPRKVQSVMGYSGGGGNNIAAAGSAAWTTLTGASASIVLDTASDLMFIVHASLENNVSPSGNINVRIKVFNGTNTYYSTVLYGQIFGGGLACPFDANLIASNVAAGTYTLQMEFAADSTNVKTSTNSGGNIFAVAVVQAH